VQEYRAPTEVVRGVTSTSLPSDFWSKMVTKEVEVQEIHASKVDVMSEIATLYETRNEVQDLASLWQDQDAGEHFERPPIGLDESEQTELEPEPDETALISDELSKTKEKQD